MSKNAKENEAKFMTSIGGQALIEGVMMRGPTKQAIVVRKPDGELESKVEDLKTSKDRARILSWPFIRGTVNFISSMVTGVKALTYSAQFMPEEEQEEPSKVDQWIEKKIGGEKAEKIIIGLGVTMGIVLSVALFILLPTILAGLLNKVVPSRALMNILEGVLRITIFVFYMWLVSKMKEIKRVWQYHGAEHKTIHCYEKGLDLTVENARPQPRPHPRCGTSFMFLVMLISMLVFSVVTWQNVFVRMAMRIVLLPVVVGISYELIKIAGRHDNVITHIISAPGKLLQRLTTAEPDDEMLEVAIASIKLVIPDDGSDKL